MKVSIITATFNSARYVDCAIQSVAGQSYPDIEYIVVDGCSTDDTLMRVKSHGDVIDTLICEPDTGIYDALNKGLGSATGDVIGFVHSDDLLASPEVISDVVSAFEDSGVLAVYGDLVYVAQDDINRAVRYWKSREYAPDLLARGWMPPHPTLYVRRVLYEKTGGFDTAYSIAADYDSILKIFGCMSELAGCTCYLPRVMIKMRQGGASNRSLQDIIRKSREDLAIMRRHKIGGLGTLAAKNLSKISQYFSRA